MDRVDVRGVDDLSTICCSYFMDASNNHVRVADFLLLRHAMHAHHSLTHSLTLTIYISAHAGTAQRRTHAGRLGRGK